MYEDTYQSIPGSKGVNTLPIPYDYNPGKYKVLNQKLYWGSDWIDFKPEMFSHILTKGPPLYDYSRIDLPRSIKGEILRFLISLEIWERTPGEKIVSAQDVWINSLTHGPEYADELDDLFSLTWRERDIPSYNFCFPARLLPRFNQNKNDLVLAQEETYADADYLDAFRETLADLLEDLPDISLPSDAEILFEKSTTTSYVHKLKREMPQWEAMEHFDGFETERLRGTRCIVPVYPGGIRDTIIADINCNCSIRWYERAMRHILQYVPESAVVLHSSHLQRRIDNVIHKDGWHVLRDLKKCCITYNSRDLFKIVSEELNRKYPDERWKRLLIFQDFSVIDDGVEYPCKRGYGLGMANHTVTLCNIVIHRMALAQMHKHLDCKCSCIVGNDDEDVAFYGSDFFSKLKLQAEEYLSVEHEIHAQLGNTVNVKKSSVQPFGLFYEQYSKAGWIHKESLVCGPLAAAYLAPNIRIAKHYIFSQSDRFESVWARTELQRLISYWGEEFFHTGIERKIHYEIGGWLDTRSLGLKTTLRDVYALVDMGYEQEIFIAYTVCKKYMQGPLPKFRTQEIVCNFAYQGLSKKTNPRLQIYCLGEKDLREYYKRLTSWQRNSTKRLYSYDPYRFYPKVKSIQGVIEGLLAETPWYTIPRELVISEGFSKQQIPFDTDAEYCMHENRNIMERIYDDQIEVPNITFDPFVVQDATMYLDEFMLIRASPFSNVGLIPILEFWYQYGDYPLCYPVGRPYTYVEPPGRERIPFTSHTIKIKVEDRKENYDYYFDVGDEKPPDEENPQPEVTLAQVVNEYFKLADKTIFAGLADRAAELIEEKKITSLVDLTATLFAPEMDVCDTYNVEEGGLSMFGDDDDY
jgi:hypothetical protein